MVSLIALALLAASPDAGTPPPLLQPPLGHIGDVVTDPPPEGIPGRESYATIKLPHCEKAQTLWVSRYVMGSVAAASQIDRWIAAQPALKKKLFKKGSGLEDAAKNVRATNQQAPPQPCLPGSAWKLSPETTVPDRGAPKSFPMQWTQSGAWVVRISPAPMDAQDFCRPRISSLLYDSKGKARFALHGDYGGELTAVVYGDRCEVLTFALDKESNSFVATPSKRDDCDPKQQK